jgi:hypothetical protein
LFWHTRKGVQRATALVACCGLFATACGGFKEVERVNTAPGAVANWSAADQGEMKERSPFLKAHMRNGDLFILSEWSVREGTVVSGSGTRYDPARVPIYTGFFDLSIDSVAVFETNQLENAGATAALTALAVITAGVAFACLTNPKACFGSCPTFYVAGHDRPLAEGFSASIAPFLEATDVDALRIGEAEAGRFDVVMKNEAYETHVVQHVDVLAFPTQPGSRIVAALDGTFREARHLREPLSVVGPEGDCAALLRDNDGVERFSFADSSDLAAKETIEIAFDGTRAGSHGLLIGSRQSLLSTYLLYQAYAYMGRDAGYWMAEIERGHLVAAGDALIEAMGGIAVSIESAPGSWTSVGEVLEFGPIATDEHLIPFEAPASWTGRVRLELAKGAWRIDDVMLATLGGRVEPIRLSPRAAVQDSVPNAAALVALLDPAQALVTLPGDQYTLAYQLPTDHATYQVFLESRGYYLEWIREEWMREGNPFWLAQLFFDPRAALVRLAPEFKKVEAGMEQVFWSSRYAKP